MGKVFKSVFGGGSTSASKKSQEAQLAENRRNQQFIQQMAGQARSDVLGLIPAGMQSQLDVFGRGNYGAQNIIAQSAPQYQNAILGLPVDYSYLQPQQLSVDTSYLDKFTQPQQTQQTQVPQYGRGLSRPSNGYRGGMFNLGSMTDFGNNRRIY